MVGGWWLGSFCDRGGLAGWGVLGMERGWGEFWEGWKGYEVVSLGEDGEGRGLTRWVCAEAGWGLFLDRLGEIQARGTI